MNYSKFSIGQAARQRGLTLIEFMVAIVLGMILVAAIATLIANQSTNRADIDRSGKMIENGRYALQAIAQDAEMAGYWGSMPKTPDPPAALPDPCVATVAALQDAMGLHVQGYDNAATVPSCLSTGHVKAGTDILVVRRVDPDTSDVETGGLVDWARLNAGQIYLQTGVNTATDGFGFVLALATGNATTDSTTFNMTRRGTTNAASPRKYLVHIYYIATCDICSGAGADTIPSLKRVDLQLAAGAMGMAAPVTIAQGIEDMQIDYGLDNDPAGGDGAPDGAFDSGTTFSAANWGDVMALKVNLLARSTEATPGYADTKAYVVGDKSVAAANDGYRRHVFVQSVRIVNPSSRRAG